MIYKLPITLVVILFCFLTKTNAQSQNLFDLSAWTVGTGSITDFSKYGAESSNVRESGHNHIGQDVVLWKAIPDAASIAEGGIYSAYKNIDNTKTYRLSIWVRKTNSNDGRTFFGCYSRSPISVHHTLNLDNSLNENPYFWKGDLPVLDRWYLLVAYVHQVGYSGPTVGQIYDGVTGEVIQTSTPNYDFKFSSTATNLMLRAFLYDDPNLEDRHYLYSPRMEVVDGSETPIADLLSLNQNSRLFLSFDNAGNQTQRLYCPDGNECVPTLDSKQGKGDVKEIIAKTEPTEADVKDLSRSIIIHPNPTKGLARIEIQSELHSKIEFIKIYNANSSLLQEFDTRDLKQELRVDLSGKPSGIYFVHIHFNDDSDSVTKKIIKE